MARTPRNTTRDHHKNDDPVNDTAITKTPDSQEYEYVSETTDVQSEDQHRQREQDCKTPVRTVPRGKMLADAENILLKYEKVYEMSSEKMATLLELDAIRPTAEVLKWYSTFRGAKLLREKTPTTGTRGTITELSTTAD